jgi:hypothetical protein
MRHAHLDSLYLGANLRSPLPEGWHWREELSRMRLSWRGGWVIPSAHFWVRFAMCKPWFRESSSWFGLSFPTQLTRKKSSTTSYSFCPPASGSQESPLLAPSWWGVNEGSEVPSGEVEDLPQLFLFEAESCPFLVLSFESNYLLHLHSNLFLLSSMLSCILNERS